MASFFGTVYIVRDGMYNTQFCTGHAVVNDIHSVLESLQNTDNEAHLLLLLGIRKLESFHFSALATLTSDQGL